MRGLSRRGFLAACGGALVGTALPHGALGGTTLPGGTVHRRPGALTQSRPQRDWVLDVQWLEHLIDGHPVRLRTYGGTVPGPLLQAWPGESVRILVRNHLTTYDSSAWDGNHNVPHHLNTTNLHLHGLEIVPHLFDPVGTPERGAPMIAIEPGQERAYLFELPDDQPPGFFWYHPHHHGSTAVQVLSGMAGGFVVRGAIDEVPEIAAAREVLLVLQDIGLFPSDDEPGRWEYNPKQNAIWNTFDGKVYLGTDKQTPTDLKGGFSTGDYAVRYYLVNGQPYFRERNNPTTQGQPMPHAEQLPWPRYSLRPGEVVRFRMLNGNSDNLMPIVVEGHDLHLIALDGVNFPELRTRPAPAKALGGEPQLLLAPANRAEFLIKAGDPGRYRIVQQQQTQQFLFSDEKIIAELVVEGAAREMELPAALPPPTRHYPLIRDDEIGTRREVMFSASFRNPQNPIVGMDALASMRVLPSPDPAQGNLYREDVVEDACVVRRGDAEEWVLRVPDSAHGGNEGHPFHVHVNSFEVISIGGVAQEPGLIQDTVWVRQDSDVVIRMRFREWTGKSVFHCHILPHEDTGMMKNFLIEGERP